ncbi:hypothetical protein BB560_004558, partial [Smittium megazygosporum]
MDPVTKSDLDRVSPLYWTIHQVSAWIESKFHDKELASTFQENCIDGGILVKFLTYNMLRVDMKVVIGKAARVIEELVNLLEQWELPSSRLRDKHYGVNLETSGRAEINTANQNPNRDGFGLATERIPTKRALVAPEPEYIDIIPKKPKDSSKVSIFGSSSLFLANDSPEHPPAHMSRSSSRSERIKLEDSQSPPGSFETLSYHKPAVPYSCYNETVERNLFGSTKSANQYPPDAHTEKRNSKNISPDNVILQNKKRLYSDNKNSSHSKLAALSKSVARIDAILQSNKTNTQSPVEFSGQRTKPNTDNKNTILGQIKSKYNGSKIHRHSPKPTRLNHFENIPSLHESCWKKLNDTSLTSPFWFRRLLGRGYSNSSTLNDKILYSNIWLKRLLIKEDSEKYRFDNSTIAHKTGNFGYKTIAKASRKAPLGVPKLLSYQERIEKKYKDV